MSALEKLLLIGAGVVVGCAVASAASGSSSEGRRLPAPQPPEPIDPDPPPPKVKKQPPARRIHRWEDEVVDDDGVVHPTVFYAPTDSGATSPWVVTAWYDEKLDAEVIRVAFNHTLAISSSRFAVRWKDEYTPNRDEFRRNNEQIWPDAMWNDRVIFRWRNWKTSGCFLIDVCIDGKLLDFYHEPLREKQAASSPCPALDVIDAIDVPQRGIGAVDVYRNELLKIEAERKKLDDPDLPRAVKDKLENYLVECEKAVERKYMETVAPLELFDPSQ